MKHFLSTLFLAIGFICTAQTEISGKITAEGKAVPYASIYFEGTEIGTTSSEIGEYIIKTNGRGNSILTVSAVGFETVRRKVSLSANKHLTEDFNLRVAEEELREIQIVDQQTGLSRKTPYNVSTISVQGIQNQGKPGGLMGILKEVPGVYAAEFGHGIMKPFIRGLGFSRIVSVYQGNKLENHQWGEDHGLGLNSLGIRQVDVIKGPASVLYGSGALGGVLLSRDSDYYLRTTDWTGELGGSFNSVSKGIRTHASLGRSFNSGFFLATDLAYESHADYIGGNDQFTDNSRFNTQTLRLHTGIERTGFKNKLSFSYNLQNLGIIGGEEIEDDQSPSAGRNAREMKLPFQVVKDYLVSYNQNTSGESLETYLHLSHHFNDRKEIETPNAIDLGLQQSHSFYNARISSKGTDLKHSLGAQGSLIINKNVEEALDFLIPDARILDNALFYLADLSLGSLFLQGALRYDYRHVEADASSEHLVEYGFILPGDPEDRKLFRSFDGFTGSLGATQTIGERNTLKFNISTGFRAPDLAELFSNGPHPGTSRFEMGNADFQRERSLQADAVYMYSNKRLTASLSGFLSKIDNYILFTATDKTAPREEMELWEYEQTNARLHGMEFELKYTWFPDYQLETVITGALVRATDLQSEQPLTFIPPDNFNLELGYYGLEDRSLHLFTRLRLIADQKRVGLNEEVTAGYTLLNVGVSKTFGVKSKFLETSLTFNNALDKSYMDHMSILRTLEVNSPGRNIMLNFNFKF